MSLIQYVKTVFTDAFGEPNTDSEILGIDADYLGQAGGKPLAAPICRHSPPSKRAAVVASMRNEGIVLLEWIAHYRVLGFDTIIIYSNDNDDGSDEMLSALSKVGVIYHYRNITGPNVAPQFKAYRHAFWHSREVAKHDWVTFLDGDEFLIPLVEGEMVPIGRYLDHIEKTYRASAVSLNWRWFAGDLAYRRQPGLLFDRFKTSAWHDHVKTMFRIRDASDIDIHCAWMLPKKDMIDGAGQIRELPTHRQEPHGALGQINHYWNRSFQEFFFKRNRGLATGEREPRPWSTFFEWTHPSATDQHPSQAHVTRVRDEIARLRKLRGVKAAETSVERKFEEACRSPEIAEIYNATRNAHHGAAS